MNMLDLSSLKPDRFFVAGGVHGNEDALIDILYEQGFNYRDILVLTGNFVDKHSDQLIDILLFLRNNENCFSVLGKNEVDLLQEYEDKILPEILYELLAEDLISFIEDLPLIIKLTSHYYVVNAGVQPYLKLSEQDESVFYSIGEFDEESRFYQFHNPEKKSWYDFDFEGDIMCFSSDSLDRVETPAGYNLGSVESELHCLILTGDEVVITSSDHLYYN